MDFINEFYDKWNWDYLVGNKSFFNKVIGPVIDENFIAEVMTIIGEKNHNKIQLRENTQLTKYQHINQMTIFIQSIMLFILRMERSI